MIASDGSERTNYKRRGVSKDLSQLRGVRNK